MPGCSAVLFLVDQRHGRMRPNQAAEGRGAGQAWRRRIAASTREDSCTSVRPSDCNSAAIFRAGTWRETSAPSRGSRAYRVAPFADFSWRKRALTDMNLGLLPAARWAACLWSRAGGPEDIAGTVPVRAAALRSAPARFRSDSDQRAAVTIRGSESSLRWNTASQTTQEQEPVLLRPVKSPGLSTYEPPGRERSASTT